MRRSRSPSDISVTISLAGMLALDQYRRVRELVYNRSKEQPHFDGEA
jgi:hypothetical protein